MARARRAGSVQQILAVPVGNDEGGGAEPGLHRSGCASAPGKLATSRSVMASASKPRPAARASAAAGAGRAENGAGRPSLLTRRLSASCGPNPARRPSRIHFGNVPPVRAHARSSAISCSLPAQAVRCNLHSRSLRKLPLQVRGPSLSGLPAPSPASRGRPGSSRRISVSPRSMCRLQSHGPGQTDSRPRCCSCRDRCPAVSEFLVQPGRPFVAAA